MLSHTGLSGCCVHAVKGFAQLFQSAATAFPNVRALEMRIGVRVTDAEEQAINSVDFGKCFAGIALHNLGPEINNTLIVDSREEMTQIINYTK